MIERMDIDNARAKRDAKIKRRHDTTTHPRVRLTNETYRPNPTSDDIDLLDVSGIVALNQVFG